MNIYGQQTGIANVFNLSDSQDSMILNHKNYHLTSMGVTTSQRANVRRWKNWNPGALLLEWQMMESI